jgi:hypothetical protein
MGRPGCRTLGETTITTLTTKSASPYTAAMVTIMRERAPLNQAICQELAGQFTAMTGGKHTFSSKSLSAKATRENIPYVRKVPVSKTGAPIEKKETIVAQIEQMVSRNLDGLDKAPKPALQSVRDAFRRLFDELEAQEEGDEEAAA